MFKFRHFKHFLYSETLQSLVAFLALNGDLSTDINGDRYLVSSHTNKYTPLTEEDFSFQDYQYQITNVAPATTLSDIETQATNATVPTRINVTKATFTEDDTLTLNNTVPIEINFNWSTVRGLITFNGNNTTLVNFTLTGGTYQSDGWTNGAGVFDYGLDNKIVNAIFDDARQRTWIVGWLGHKRLRVQNSIFKNKLNNLLSQNVFHLVAVTFQDKDATIPTNNIIEDCLFKDIPVSAYGNGGEIFSPQILPTPYPSNTTDWYTHHEVYGINTENIYRNNIHVRCDGDGEILSIKSNGVTMENLSFIDCQGELSIRQGQNHTLDKIHFIRGYRGLRIGAKNVTATNIYSYNQSDDVLTVLCGGSTSGNDTDGAWYQQCENVNIDKVTIIGGDKGLRTVSVEPDPDNDLLPLNCSFSNIAMKDTTTPEYQTDRMTNPTFTNIVESGVAVNTLKTDVVVPTDITLGPRFYLNDYSNDVLSTTGRGTYLNNQKIIVGSTGVLSEFTVMFRLLLSYNPGGLKQIISNSNDTRYIKIENAKIVLRTSTSNVVTNFTNATIPTEEWTDIIVTGKNNMLSTYINNISAHTPVDVGAEINTYSIIGQVNTAEVNHSIRDLIIINKEIDSLDRGLYTKEPESIFKHSNNESSFIDHRLSFTKADVVLNMPLRETGSNRKDFVTGTEYLISDYTAACNLTNITKGLQQIAFNADMTYADTMGFDVNQSDVIVATIV